MKLNYQRVVVWAQTRGILDQSTAQFQMLKGTEEHGEMAGAILRGDREELIDAIGDQLVVAIIQCAQLGYNLSENLCGVKHFNYSGNTTSNLVDLCESALEVTEAQGAVAGALARGKNADAHFLCLFTHIFAFCSVENIDPSEALDSVYDIIVKRDGAMRNGVWVKSGDL